MRPATVVGLLVLLLGIQPITTDLYLPALPMLQRELGAGMPATQLTLSALIIAFGLAQLVAGPLADRHGRRPVLLVGLAAYALASLGAALSPSIEALVAWRVLQGVAMAASVTGARSILRDLYEPREGAQVMSRAMGGLGVIALLSPLAGGLIAQHAGWHAALAVLAAFGAATLAAVALCYVETVPRRDPCATRLAPLARNWAIVLAHPGFRAWAGLSALAYGGLFVVLAGSSFVYIEVLGVSRIGYGALMAGNGLAYVVGTVVCRRWLVRHGLRATVRRGAWFSLAGGLGMALLALGGLAGVAGLFACQCLFALGHGVHQPCGQAGAVGPFPEKAGTAASLSGFLMMLSAFGVGLWMGTALDGTVRPLAYGLGVFGCAIALVAWTLVQRDGEPAARPAPAGGAVSP
ncbi:multidrug resistance transporter, Bcr/CflA family [Piscinibacter sakaiensis]|uniref:Bcr/CflA family efflux transporter n=2 Tax=Piscinibacter sakaiensis TaxID=1547922 RepID=A0A0K8P7S9_PISS1|nr:multidrug resistance transporter, Bcr/CflA family [Piscinibacter sakaiensis]